MFDRQESLNVVLEFPQGSKLATHESETFEVVMIGDAARPDVDFRVLSQITNYRVVDRVLQGRELRLKLEGAL